MCVCEEKDYRLIIWHSSHFHFNDKLFLTEKKKKLSQYRWKKSRGEKPVRHDIEGSINILISVYLLFDSLEISWKCEWINRFDENRTRRFSMSSILDTSEMRQRTTIQDLSCSVVLLICVKHVRQKETKRKKENKNKKS